MDAGLDTGDMLYKAGCDIIQKIPVHPCMKNSPVSARRHITDTVSGVSECTPPLKNRMTPLVTYAEKLSKEANWLDWSLSATD